jgi:hypothetical protein
VLLAATALLSPTLLAVVVPAVHAAPAPAVAGPRAASKVADVVTRFAAAVGRERAAGRSAARLSNRLLHATAGGRIELLVHAAGPISAAQEDDLRRNGAVVTDRLTPGAQRLVGEAGFVQVMVPHSQVADIAALDWVAAVTPPEYTEVDNHPNNPINSQGVALHRAVLVQNRGINGTGVTVGVVSDGVSNLAASQAANELPAVTVLDAGSGDEGTAMLEIVHDMAPGAGLMFDGTGSGVTAHINSLNNLVSNGADVLTEDIPFDAEPAFQVGAAAQAGENIASAGVPIHSSAGNQSNRHAARVPATGTGTQPDGTANTFTGCTNTPDNVVAIAPGGDTTFDVTLSSSASFTLQWSEPRAIAPTAGQGGFTDLNLYLMNSTLTQCLAQSTGVQGNGVGDTIEQMAINGLNGTNAKIVVDVQAVNGAVATPLIDLRWRGATAVDTPTRAGALNPDSNYTGLATSAAAVDAQNVTSGIGALESYSSSGPVQLITTTQCPGGAAGPCVGTAVAGSSATSNAPTWAAADDVSVSGVGGFGSPFTGTSAAAPHAAGCDALLRDALNNANAAVSTTNARLAATATDIAPAGTDTNTGAGQLDCLAAVNTAPNASAGGPYQTPEGTNVTLDASGSSDPDTTATFTDTLTYAWDLDNDGQYDDATGPSPSFTTVGQDGVYPVAVQVTDTAGATDTASSNVTVTNVAPTVGTITTDAPKNENTATRITGAITDPGWLDVLTATIDFGDGNGAVALSGVADQTRPDASLTYDVSHTYGDNGNYQVTICAADDDTTNNCRSTNVGVRNVVPTAAISTVGSTLVNGVPTFVTHAGLPVSFSGSSTDPGSDDLTLTWNWDDGAPAPDVSTTSLVNPPNADPANSPSIQPRDVTDPRTHTFGGACLYNVVFGSTDDDGGSATQTITAIITGNATANRSAGYWYTTLRDGRTVSSAQAACLLAIADYMSRVFHEKVDAQTVARALAVLNPPTNKTTPSQQLDRQLLAAWLNFANGSIDLSTPVDVTGDKTPDTTFGAAMTAAENVRLNPASTSAQLTAQKTMIERINVRDGG